MGRGKESKLRRSRTNKKAKEEKENCMMDVNGSGPLVTDSTAGLEDNGTIICTKTSTGNGNKKKGRDNDDTNIAEDDGGEKHPKRHCTTIATAVKSAESAAEIGIVTCVSSEVDNNDDGLRVLSLLPTGIQLSMELCKIVDLIRYGRHGALQAMDQLFHWSSTKDSKYLTCFDLYSGIVRVFDFLKEAINIYSNTSSLSSFQIMMASIEKAASVIKSVCFVGVDGVNIDIATKIATSAILDCDGIQTLMLASEECTVTRGGFVRDDDDDDDDIVTNQQQQPLRFKVLNSIWAAVRNIITTATTTIYSSNKDQANILYTGMNIISQLNKSIHDVPIAATVLVHVVATLSTIVKNDYVTKKYFQDQRMLTKCVDLFKEKNNDNPSEMLTYTVLMFFYRCHSKNLLLDNDADADDDDDDMAVNDGPCSSSLSSSSSGYELLFPFLYMSVKKFPTNHKIRKIVIDFIDSIVGNKKKTVILEKGGVMEILGVILAFDTIKKDEKKKVRALISTIINNAGVA